MKYAPDIPEFAHARNIKDLTSDVRYNHSFQSSLFHFKLILLFHRAHCPYFPGPTAHITRVLLNHKERKETMDPFSIRVRVRAAYLSSVIVIMILEAK